jgi:hypothetical protein
LLPPGYKVSPDQRRLLKLFSGLGEQDRSALLAFAQFLDQRRSEPPEPRKPLPEPDEIPRPAQESVVGAIKRLAKTYYMLDTQAIFNETASLMTAHIMQGRPAPEVIDELEALFEQRYQHFRTESDDEKGHRT